MIPCIIRRLSNLHVLFIQPKTLGTKSAINQMRHDYTFKKEFFFNNLVTQSLTTLKSYLPPESPFIMSGFEAKVASTSGTVGTSGGLSCPDNALNSCLRPFEPTMGTNVLLIKQQIYETDQNFQFLHMLLRIPSHSNQ